MKVRSILKILIRWIPMAILFFVVLELCARTDDYLKWKAPFWGEYSEDLLANTDSLGYRNVPGARFQKWRVNSFGFRSPEITEAKPPGVIRVMVLGASETFGLYESADKEFPAQMQQILDSEYPGRFQVINAASAGMTLPRVTRYYQDYLYNFSPDIVIYYPTPSQYLSSPPPHAETTQYRPFIREKQFSSRLKPKIFIALKKSLPLRLQIWIKEIQMYLFAGNQQGGKIIEHPAPELFQLFRNHLTKLIQVIDISGPHIILATHGNAFGQALNMISWRDIGPRVSESCLLEIDTGFNEIIRDCANVNDVALADIYSAIPKNSECYADHLHFTDKGAAIAANAFVEAIKQISIKYYLVSY